MQENRVRESQAFEFFATLRESWHLTKGAKWAIWNPMLIVFLLSIAGLFGMGMIASHFIFLGVPIVLICLYCFFGILAGLIKTIFACTQKHDLSIYTRYHDFSRVFPLLFTCLFAMILIKLPQMVSFFLHPSTSKNMQQMMRFNFFDLLRSIYELVMMSFLYLSPALAVDKKNSPFEAIKVSFKTVRPYCLKILGILFLQVLIFSLGFSAVYFLLGTSIIISAVVGVHTRLTLELITVVAVVVLIAQIWLFPFMCLVFGVVYDKLVGIPVSPPVAEMSSKLLPQKELLPKGLSSVRFPLLISGALALISCLLVSHGGHAIKLMLCYTLVFLVTVFSFVRNSSRLPQLFLIVASVVGCIAIPIMIFLVLISMILGQDGGSQASLALSEVLLLPMMALPLLLGISIVWGWSCYARKKYTHALLFALLPLYFFSYLPLLFTGYFL